jgi:parallel beta-helix repeat protein
MRKLARVGTLLFVAGFVFWTWAGNLEPPSAPAPTGRSTIFQVDMPLTITNPGSFVVMENLTGVAGFHGIDINATGVTIDLNGFALAGVPGSLDGINACSSCDNITISNGSIRDWGTAGMALAMGPNRVMDIHAYRNGSSGIVVDVASVVTNVLAELNGADGIVVGRGSVVTDSVARSNTGDGIRGASDGILISGCSSFGNKGDGIQVNEESYVVGNMSSSNGAGVAFDGAAIHTIGIQNRIESNHANNSDRGIDIDDPDNIIIKNSASGNTADYSIVGGNTVGPILGAADPIVSTNPWANFSY